MISTLLLSKYLFQNTDDSLHLFNSVIMDERDAGNSVVDVDLGVKRVDKRVRVQVAVANINLQQRSTRSLQEYKQ